MYAVNDLFIGPKSHGSARTHTASGLTIAQGKEPNPPALLTATANALPWTPANGSLDDGQFASYELPQFGHFSDAFTLAAIPHPRVPWAIVWDRRDK